VLGISTDPGNTGLLGHAYLVVVPLQIGGVGSLFKHVFATLEAVRTLLYEFVYHMISDCRFVAHPHVMLSVGGSTRQTARRSAGGEFMTASGKIH